MTKWRLMEPEDLDAVKALHQRQCEALGVEFEFCNPFSRPVMLALVHEDCGVIDQGIFLEAIAEASFVGVKALPRSEYVSVVDDIAQNMRLRGIRLVQAFVLNSLVDKLDTERRDRPMTRLMHAMGFSQEQNILQRFFRRP